ncbi:MAG: Rid family detoxifying hydrolase [Defluviitaleaceae bacterium]|nr:Rid family detoxifying hydrolase [Defluviitaleaceae bacterium]
MKKTINVNKTASVPYSQGTIHNGTLYVSGQLPVDPVTGELCTGNITEQTQAVMKNIAAIVEAAGAKMEDILKCTVLLTDMADFAQMNEAYLAYFPADPPARICYQVSALPRGANIEIDAIVAV